MAKSKRTLRLRAHNVLFTTDTEITFEDVLEQLRIRKPESVDRIFSAPSSSDQSVALSKFFTRPNNAGIGGVLSLFEKDAPRSVVTFETGSGDASFDVMQADGEGEFLDENTVLFSVGDYLISCGLGKRQNYLCSAIHELAVAESIIPHTTSFNFVDMPQADNIELINRHGVKKIDFDATFLLGSLRDVVGESLTSKIFSTEQTGEALKRRRENVAKLSLRKSHFWSSFTSSIDGEQDRNEWLDDVAREVVELPDLNQFTIVLNTDQEIKSGSLVLTKTIQVDRDGSTYNVDEAYEEMVKYFHELRLP